MKKYQQELAQWFRDNNWPYWTPHEILARLMEETGELARLVNHLHGPKKKKATEAEQDLEEEIGDIIYTLICYANSNNLDLDRAIQKSFDKSMTRDKDRFKSNQLSSK
jgi:NTP pyrophosphatase (non-canonical NTP hydrolase)